MRIDKPYTTNQTNQTDQAQTTDRINGKVSAKLGSQTSAIEGNPSDLVKISPRAEVIARLIARVTKLPDLRQERVDTIRALVQAGAYYPDSREIAQAIIDDESR